MRVSRTMITPYAAGPLRCGAGVDNFTVGGLVAARKRHRAVAQYNGEPAATRTSVRIEAMRAPRRPQPCIVGVAVLISGCGQIP